MIKRKDNKVIKSLIKGSLILVGLVILGYNNLSFEYTKSEDNKSFDEFFNNKENKFNIADFKVNNTKINTKSDQYVSLIEIPKINLKSGMYDIDSKNNTVDKHIQILKGSTMPNIEEGNFILASHSGTSKVSYFKHLNKLKLKDNIYIYYKTKKYTYEVYDVYKLDKDGTIEIKRDADKTMLTLTTCDTTDNTKQLVVLAYKTKKEDVGGNN